MIYFDTSIIAPYYCPEPLSELAEQRLLACKQPVISQLTLVEIKSALSRKIREKSLSREDGNRILNQFRLHTEEHGFYRILSLNDSHYKLASNWIEQFSTALRTLDALHLALASLGNLKLVTADKGLTKAARYFGLDVDMIDPI